MNNDLVKKFQKTIKIKPSNTKKIFSIGFIGTTGVGKSTTSKMLGKELGLYVASNDKIRRFMNKNGIPGMFPDQNLMMEIAERSSEYLYKNKISHIIDADLVRYHKKARKNAEKYGARLFIIHLVCPEEVILERLHIRKGEIKKEKNKKQKSYSHVGHSLSTYKEYKERTAFHNKTPLPDNIFFTFDSSKNTPKQISEIKSKLKSGGVI